MTLSIHKNLIKSQDKEIVLEYWALDPSGGAGSAPVHLATNLIKVMGSSERGAIAEAVLDMCSQVTQIEHCSILGVNRSTGAQVVSGASRKQAQLMYDVGDLYRTHFFGQDAAQRLIRDVASDHCDQLLLHRRLVSHIEDQKYRALCYESVNACDRISILASDHRDFWFAINLYRDASVGPFSANDIAGTAAIAPLIGQAVMHCRKTGATEVTAYRAPLEDRVRALHSALSQREYEVLVHIARGLTLDGIGAQLGIRRTTAITYRNRAFTRLGIYTRQQLFGLLTEPPARTD